MNMRNRKLRLGILLGISVIALYFAWRTQVDKRPRNEPCVPSREEVKDDSGKIVEIKRKECFKPVSALPVRGHRA